MKIDSLQAMSWFRTIAIASQFWFSGRKRGMGWSIKKIDSLQAMRLFRTIAIAAQFWFWGEGRFERFSLQAMSSCGISER